jgi:hypothetical protein
MAEPVGIGTKVKLLVDGREVLGTVTKVNAPVIGACRVEFECSGEKDAVTLPAEEIENARDTGQAIIP